MLKKRTNRFLAVALAFILVFVTMMPVTAFATESDALDMQNAPAIQDARIFDQLDINGSIKGLALVAGGSETHYIFDYWGLAALDRTYLGFNCNVTIQVQYAECTRIDIQMIDKSGNVAWQEQGAISVNGTRTFWAGPDIIMIQAKVYSGVHLSPKAFLYAYW